MCAIIILSVLQNIWIVPVQTLGRNKESITIVSNHVHKTDLA